MPRQKLTARTDGRYKCQYQNKYFYGKTQAEARRKRDEYVRELTLGNNPELTETSFLEYGLSWLDVYRTECNTKQRQQYMRVIETAAQVLNKHYLKQINATDIQRLFNSQQGMSDSHISKFCSTIRAVFRSAVMDGIILKSPAEMAKRPEGTCKGHRCLEKWEQDLIVETYHEHDFGICAMVMLFAGLRRGELLYLDVDRDVDYKKKTITIRGGVSFAEGNQATVTDGKTKAAQRVIPLNDILADALKNRHGLLCRKEDGSMMSLMSFTRKYESYILFLETKINGCNRRWYGKTKEHKALIKEGKDLPPWRSIDITCHDFRVTFCTMCYEAGIPVKTLQVWMGHSDASMIMKIYAKLTAEKEQADASIMNIYMKDRFKKEEPKEAESRKKAAK